ncbi:MAG TPA: choice-of-anchor Q domain-containing protein [Candidatus Methylacidiphilales bacterium]|nr:choice-of-anchor Q domain-containing protein [Candidatus Methylacidiphilales bacterium]
MRALTAWCIAWVTLPVQLPIGCWANPQGGTVVGGSASISSPGAGQVVVKQSSNRAIVNWQSFSSRSGETTTFVQPSSKSAILNRVTGGNRSQLDGNLNASGQVYLVNPNGVVIGKSGRINAAGFTASTHDVANAEFMKGGDLNFSGSSRAAVVNHGKIRATDGDVTLIARQVENHGKISAKKGSVNLAGGTEVLIKPGSGSAGGGDGQRVYIKANSGDGSVVNTGGIRAAAAELRAAGGNEYALAIRNSGVIRATAVDKSGGRIVLRGERGGKASGTVENSGRLVARAQSPGKSGGGVVVTGEHVRLTSTSRIDVSSPDAGGKGGTVNIGGGYQGKDAAIANAKTTTVEAGSEINADGGAQGGTSILWSQDATFYAGSISAKGPDGKGGFVEISSKGYLDFNGSVATNGGTLLLDPGSISISNAASSNLTDDGLAPRTYGHTAGSSSILNVDTLTGLLSTTNVTLLADDSITVDAPIVVTTGGFDLTLTTSGFITVNAAVSLTSAGSILQLNTPTLNLYVPLSSSQVISAPSTVNVYAGASIQQGIGLVAGGGTVNVGPGTFGETVSISKSLTLSGDTVGTGTIIDGELVRPGVRIAANRDVVVTLQNISITRGVSGYTSAFYPSDISGAGLWIEGFSTGIVSVQNVKIYGNGDATTILGGGVFTNTRAQSQVTFDNVEVYNNRASSGGGMFNVVQGAAGKITINNSRIHDNIADLGAGGGLYNNVPNGGEISITNSQIYGNRAGSGGGMWNDSTSGVIAIVDTRIYGNEARIQGGGVGNSNAEGSTISYTRTSVTDNHINDPVSPGTGRYGAGIYSTGSGSLSLTEVLVSGNIIQASTGQYDTASGGGIYAKNIWTATDSTFSFNSVYGNNASGGGITTASYIHGPYSTITNSTINGNTTQGVNISDGGGVFNTGNLSMVNVTISGNQALSLLGNSGVGWGGGIMIIGEVGTTLKHATIAYNKADSAAGGVYMTGRSFTSINDSIVSLNTAGTDPNVYAIGRDTFYTQSYSLIDSDNPGLAPLGDYGGKTQTHALLDGSPALNSSSSDASTDQRGFNDAGTRNDMGSYEARSSVAFDYVVTNTKDYIPGSAPIANSLRLGTELAEKTYITFNIPVLDPGYSAGVWTIQATPGSGGNGFNIVHSLTIDGSTQPGYTPGGSPVIVVKGGSTSASDYARVFTISGTDSITRLNALTITGGYTDSPTGGGGIYFTGDASTLDISNSIITGNRATGSGTYGGGISASASDGTLTIVNSIISANSAEDVRVVPAGPSGGSARGGGIFVEGLSLFKISGGIIRDNVARAYRSVEDADGTVFAYGGGLYQSGGDLTLFSATFDNNTAEATVLVRDGGTLFTSSHAQAEALGGGIYADGSNLNVTGTSITNNDATATSANNSSPSSTTVDVSATGNSTAKGGGVYTTKGTWTLTSVSGNTATASGTNNSAAATTGPDTTANTTTISVAQGGGIYSTGTGAWTVTNANNNAASAISVNNSISSGAGGTVVNTNADADGGAIYGNGTWTITGLRNNNAVATTRNISSLSGNPSTTSNAYGGGLYLVGGFATVTGISANSARSETTAQTVTGLDGAQAFAYSNAFGGAIFINAGNLTVQNTEITGNNATATLTNSSTVSGAGTTSLTQARASGGAISLLNPNVLRLSNSLYDDNHAATILSDTSTAASKTTNAYATGGALDIGTIATATTLRNLTITGNSAQYGGGIALTGNGGNLVTLDSLTVADNTAGLQGGGIYRGNPLSGSVSGAVIIRKSIIALNHLTTGAPSNGPDIYGGAGVYSDGGNNLIGITDGSTGWTVSSARRLGTAGAPIDPQLASLANYGGTTRTMALLPGSLALLGVSNYLGTDQRGRSEPGTIRNDIGAYESRGFTYVLSPLSLQTAVLGQEFTPFTVTVTTLDTELAAAYPTLTNKGVVTLAVPPTVLGSAPGTAGNATASGVLTQMLQDTGTPGITSATFHLTAAVALGDYTVSVLEDPAAASFSMRNLPIALTLTVDNNGKVYGTSPDPTLTYTLSYPSELLGTDTSLGISRLLLGSLTRETGENVGLYDVYTTGLALNTYGASRYTLSVIGGGANAFSITPRPITVSSVPNQHKTYGDADPATLRHHITFGNLVFGDTLTGTSTRQAGQSAGTYAITQGTLTAGNNYILTWDAGTFTILGVEEGEIPGGKETGGGGDLELRGIGGQDVGLEIFSSTRGRNNEDPDNPRNLILLLHKKKPGTGQISYSTNGNANSASGRLHLSSYQLFGNPTGEITQPRIP